MKASLNTKYGGPEVLQIMEIEKPVPKDDEVLIKVHVATVNRTDCGFLRGKPFIVHFFTGLLKPRNKILGNEFAGEIEAIGKGVTLYQPGDKVFGYNDHKNGAHAEYMVLAESDPIGIMPVNLTYEESAPLLEGGHYALCDLRAAGIGSGQRILIYGATGAIGSAAVQLSKHFGAEVTAVCGTEDVEVVKSLGADVVIDRNKEDFTKIKQIYDIVFDAVGKSSFGKCKPLLKKGGIYLSTDLGYMAQNPFLAIITPLLGGKKLLFPLPSLNEEDILFIKKLAETGEYKPLIDRHYPFDQIAKAYRYVETGQKKGNVIILVNS